MNQKEKESISVSLTDEKLCLFLNISIIMCALQMAIPLTDNQKP